MGDELAKRVSLSNAESRADSRLPLDPVLVAISELLPKIQDSASKTGAPSSKVLALIKGASLTEVLPPTPAVVPRRFQVSRFRPRRHDFIIGVRSCIRCMTDDSGPTPRLSG